MSGREYPSGISPGASRSTPTYGVLRRRSGAARQSGPRNAIYIVLPTRSLRSAPRPLLPRPSPLNPSPGESLLCSKSRTRGEGVVVLIQTNLLFVVLGPAEATSNRSEVSNWGGDTLRRDVILDQVEGHRAFLVLLRPQRRNGFRYKTLQAAMPSR